MAFESGGAQKFPYAHSQVFPSLLKILPENGFQVKSKDQEIGRIECSTGASLFSWGENIAITIEQIDDSNTRIEVHSGLKVQGGRQALVTGEGRNAKNISTIVSALSAHLKKQPKPQATNHTFLPPPAPPIRPLAFYIFLNDEVKGPYSLTQLSALLDVGTVTPTTPCCPEGTEEWETVSYHI